MKLSKSHMEVYLSSELIKIYMGKNIVHVIMTSHPYACYLLVALDEVYLFTVFCTFLVNGLNTGVSVACL